MGTMGAGGTLTLLILFPAAVTAALAEWATCSSITKVLSPIVMLRSSSLRGGGNTLSRIEHAYQVALMDDEEYAEEEQKGESDPTDYLWEHRVAAGPRMGVKINKEVAEEQDEQEPAAASIFIPRDVTGVDEINVHKNNMDVKQLWGDHRYDFDLIVIGGGSGGLACSKEAASLGAKVAVCDFVSPTPKCNTWGLGGTCVNVGCIPKKLMHRASLLHECFADAQSYGWTKAEVKHSWEAMVGMVQDHIASLNFGYRTELRSKNVTYLNEKASFVDAHTLECTNSAGKTHMITAACFVIAVGGRPKYPGIPGDKELCITSDDLFSLPKSPGKTLVVGASYVALECAGFLTGLGLNVSVMMRSIPLRGFDQDCAERVCKNMVDHGTRFLRKCVPQRFEKAPGGGVKVIWSYLEDKEEGSEVFDTVILAIGRYAVTEAIKLDKVGIKVVDDSLKIKGTGFGTGADEATDAPNIFAIGDVLEGKPELTPVAIKAGVLLAERLFGGGMKRMDYEHVATTVFTPLEYSCVGLSEEVAKAKYGDEAGGDGLDVYAQLYRPLEWQLPAMQYPPIPGRGDATCYAKVLCARGEGGRIVGMHIIGDNTGEMIQGFGLAMKLGATKDDLDSLVGVHPTGAEVLTTMGEPVGETDKLVLKGC